MKSIYQKYNEGTQVKSFTLKPETIAGLNRIRELFKSRYGHPTLSLILDQVISRHVEQLNNDPEQLQAEIEDFERRYGQKRH